MFNNKVDSKHYFTLYGQLILSNLWLKTVLLKIASILPTKEVCHFHFLHPHLFCSFRKDSGYFLWWRHATDDKTTFLEKNILTDWLPDFWIGVFGTKYELIKAPNKNQNWEIHNIKKSQKDKHLLLSHIWALLKDRHYFQMLFQKSAKKCLTSHHFRYL